MNVGTKSLLWGAHQIVWHPFTVLLAWISLYGWPNWKELVCIIIHDWGYWGSPNMEGKEGIQHPQYAAMLAKNFLDGWKNLYSHEKMSWTYHDLCLYHSRTFAEQHGVAPSKLCWADKLCVKYERWWTYLPRVYLSGEIHEYRAEAEKSGLVPASFTDIQWYNWARERMIRKAYAQDGRPPYQVGS